MEPTSAYKHFAQTLDAPKLLMPMAEGMAFTPAADMKHEVISQGASDDISALVRVADAVRATGYRFITVTPATHALLNARASNSQGRSLVDALGWSRPFAQGQIPASIFDLLASADLLQRAGDLWRSKVRFSTLNGELFMHSSFPTTAKDSVFFGPDTYKFVDAIQAYLARPSSPVTRAADICAGAGPGGVTIAKAAPRADVFMMDINPKAVRFARVNALVAGCPNARSKQSDLLSGVDGCFDLIVAHPPYLIDRDTRAYRHGGGPLGAGLAISIVKASAGRLAPGGTLLLFTGVAMIKGNDPFQLAVGPLLAEAGLEWSYREVDPDVFGEELAHKPYREVDRIALVVLTATKRYGVP